MRAEKGDPSPTIHLDRQDLRRWSTMAEEYPYRIDGFAGDTIVKTRAGDRRIEELAGGPHELLTAGGNWVSAPIRSLGRQAVSEVTLSRSGVMKRIRVTSDHRWLLRTREDLGYEVSTAALSPGNRIQVAFPPRPDRLRPDRLGIARGFVFGDGSRRRAKSVAYFCGRKDEVMLPYFDGLGRPPRTYGSVTVINGLPGEWKSTLPRLDSSASELYGWLAGYFAADGDVGKTGRPTHTSALRRNLEFFRVACQAVGVGTFGIRTRMRTGYGSEPSAMHLVGVMRADLDPNFFLIPEHRRRFEAGRYAAERRGWNVISVTPVRDRVEIYGVVVSGTHSLALVDNLLIGDCLNAPRCEVEP
jgi:hypothetical protein